MANENINSIIDLNNPVISLPELSEALNANLGSPLSFKEGGEVKDYDKYGTADPTKFSQEKPEKIGGIFKQSAEHIGEHAIRGRAQALEQKNININRVKLAIKEITLNGIKQGKKQEEIFADIEEMKGRLGVTENDLNPTRIRTSDIKGNDYGYGTATPVFSQSLKLSTYIPAVIAGGMAGGKAGAMAGSIAGPYGAGVGGFLGFVGGSALGAALQTAGYEKLGDYLSDNGTLVTPNFNEIGDFLGYTKGVTRPTKEQVMEKMKDEAWTEAKWSAAFGVARPAIAALTPIPRRLFLGVGKAEIDKAKAAGEFGVKLGVADISRYSMARFVKKPVARLPWIGTEIQQAQAKNLEALYKSFAREIKWAPTEAVEDMGINVAKAISAANAKMLKSVKDKYKKFDSAIEKDSTRFITKGHTQGVRLEAEVGLKNYMKDDLIQASPFLKDKQNFKTHLEGAIQHLKNKESITAGEWHNFIQNQRLVVDQLSRKGLGKEAQMLTNMINGMHKALGQSTKGKGLQRLLNEADDEFATMMKLFNSKVGGDLKKTGVSNWGYTAKLKFVKDNAELSKLMETAFKIESKEGMQNIHKMLKGIEIKTPEGLMKGEDIFKRAVALKLTQKFDKALGFEVTGGFDLTKLKKDPRELATSIKSLLGAVEGRKFNPKTWASSLGFDMVGSSRNQGVKEALKLSGHSYDKLQRLGKLAEKLFAEDVGSVSTFLARRGAIGGTKSLLRAYVPGLAIMGGGGAAVAGSPGPVGDWAESTGVVKALLVMMLLR